MRAIGYALLNLVSEMRPLKKPECIEDLYPPIMLVGEPGWAERLRCWLNDFDFRFAEPSTEDRINASESRLGQQLPPDWRDFQLAFGPLDFGGARLSPPEQIVRMDRVWFRSHLSPQEQDLLPNLLQIGETGSDDYVVFNTSDAWLCNCSHDPGGLWDWCPSFSDWLRVQLVRLWSGYYGWPDDDVSDLTEGLAKRWLAEWKAKREQV